MPKMRFLQAIAPAMADFYTWMREPPRKPTLTKGGVEFEKAFLTKSRCFKRGRKITPKGILLHSPAVSNPDWKWLYRRWNRQEANACTHGLVHTGGCVQLLPWNFRCWGAGRGSKGSANSTHIQFDIMEPAGHFYSGSTMKNYDAAKNKKYFETVWARAVHFCAYLCVKFNINPENIIDHSEAGRMGMASKHADISHWLSQHKKTMDDFRGDVRWVLNEQKK